MSGQAKERVSTCQTKHPAYLCWKTMRQLCLNPNNPNYERYGGRGIRISERWDDFATFAADMGPRPPKATLERIDNDGHYEPGNVRWATRIEQGQNRSHTRLHTESGKTQSLGHWMREIGNPLDLHYTTVASRVFGHNWTVRDALSVPAAMGNKWVNPAKQSAA